MSFVITEVKDAGRLEDEEGSGSYNFHWMDSKFEGLSTKEMKEKFHKWNIDQNLRVAKFRYDQNWEKGEKASTLITDFLNSRVFQDNCKVRDNKGWADVGLVRDVEVEEVTATATSCSVFDDIFDTELVAAGGQVRGCAPDEFEGVPYDNEMKRAMLDEDSEHYDVIDDELRDEFIFKLFQHFVFGGHLNQYEDNVTPYIEAVRLVYKDLMSVSKNKNTGKLEIASSVFAINGIKGGSTPLFPNDSALNKCFVVVDPFRRHLSWYYFANSGLWTNC